jgi:predicted RNase H-like HicB family nuclease
MALNFAIELEREDDGRCIAEVSGLPGVLAYGETEQAAIAAAEALALRVLADRLAGGNQAAAHPGGKAADDFEKE